MSEARAARRADLRAPAPAPAPRERTRPDLRLVRPDERPRRRATRLLTAALATVLVLALFGLVIFQTVLVQNQSRLDGLDQQVETEREQIERRELEITELESPERVIDEATSTLGMIPPTDVPMIDEVPGGEAPLDEPIPTAAESGRTPTSVAPAGGSQTGSGR
jgi:cell division protein FtsL